MARKIERGRVKRESRKQERDCGGPEVHICFGVYRSRSLRTRVEDTMTVTGLAAARVEMH